MVWIERSTLSDGFTERTVLIRKLILNWADTTNNIWLDTTNNIWLDYTSYSWPERTELGDSFAERTSLVDSFAAASSIVASWTERTKET